MNWGLTTFEGRKRTLVNRWTSQGGVAMEDHHQQTDEFGWKKREFSA